VLIVLLPAVAASQEPAESFDQLKTRVKVGDTIWVTDAQGREIKGKIRELTPASLTLDRGAAGRNFAAADVGRVRLRVDDSLLTGTLIGLGTGLAAGAAMLGQGDEDPTSGGIVGAALLFGGVGAAVGAGIDGLIHGKRDVYRAGPTARLSLAPLITPREKGVAVSFAF
jgi:hypothetical protein